MKIMVNRCVGTMRVLVGKNTLRKFSAAAKKFYDSQSGSFITLPGSQGIRLHDCRFRYSAKPTDGTGGGLSDKVIIDHLRETSADSLITTVSLPMIASDADFNAYLSTSIPYIRRNRSKLMVSIVPQILSQGQLNYIQSIAAQDTSTHELMEVEASLFANKDTHRNKANGAFNIIPSLPKLSAVGIVTRVNVYLDVDAIVDSNSKESLSVIEMGEIFARLCDAGVKVINICLTSKRIQRPGDMEATAAEEVLDYLREIIEEGLNLDVAGDPLLERLSVQCVDTALLPGLTELVLSLGLTRLSVCGLQGNGSAQPGATGSVGDSVGVRQLNSECKTLVGSLYGTGGAHSAILPFLNK